MRQSAVTSGGRPEARDSAKTSASRSRRKSNDAASIRSSRPWRTSAYFNGRSWVRRVAAK